jgi:hypothetical protein
MKDDTHSEPEIRKTKKWLKKIKPHALISRDKRTYDSFCHMAEHSYNGIDCGFFVSESYGPIEIEAPAYTILNFDKRPEPNLSQLGLSERDYIIRTHHSFWHNFSLINYPKMRNEYYMRKNTLISELPSEYLNVYAGSSVTYSDRVHACVATIAYGNSAQLMHDTPRSLLFERVGMGDISRKPVEPDIDKLENEKEQQIQFMTEIL